MIALNYGRSGSITAQNGTCSLCGQDILCLVVDGSEGEYGEILCCRACVEYCFEQAAVPTDSKEGMAALREKARLWDALESIAYHRDLQMDGTSQWGISVGRLPRARTLAEAVTKAMEAEGAR